MAEATKLPVKIEQASTPSTPAWKPFESRRLLRLGLLCGRGRGGARLGYGFV